MVATILIFMDSIVHCVILIHLFILVSNAILQNISLT